jgi:hypothetical protein
MVQDCNRLPRGLASLSMDRSCAAAFDAAAVVS